MGLASLHGYSAAAREETVVKSMLIALLMTGLVYAAHAQSAGAAGPVKTIVNNQFFYDKNPHPESLERWDYQKAVTGKYDHGCALFLSGVVDQIGRVNDKEFRYYIDVDNGPSGGRSMVIALVPQVVSSVQVGTSVGLFGFYKNTQTAIHTAESTGTEEKVSVPAIDIAALGYYVSDVGIQWLYVLK